LLPASIDPTKPKSTDLRSDIGVQIRAFKQDLIDIFGLPANVTASAFNITASGAVVMPNTTKNIPLVLMGKSQSSFFSQEVLASAFPALTFSDSKFREVKTRFSIFDNFDIAQDIKIGFDWCYELSGTGNFSLSRDYRVVATGENVSTGGNAATSATMTLAKGPGMFNMQSYTGTDFNIQASHIAAVGESVQIALNRLGTASADTASGRLYIWNIRAYQL